MIPVRKVEIWQGGARLYDATDDADNIRIHEVLTDSIGTFEFTLPTKKNGDYLYNDVNPFDTVKIWLDYDAVPTDPLTIGKIYRITAPLKIDTGYIRVFSGKNQGEILERQIKGRKTWVNTSVSDIVTELATTDLGLGTKFDAPPDTTAVTMTTDADTYFDLLKKLSDYWTPIAIVKKDFFVDWENDLVWKNRATMRTVGVETLTVGVNILSYNLVYDGDQVKNKIYVYGEKAPFNALDPSVIGRKFPSDGDQWTWENGWLATIGSVASNADSPKVPATCTRGTSNGASECEYHKLISQTWVEGLAGYGAIELWNRRSQGTVNSLYQVRLWAPDVSNYFETDFACGPSNGVWGFGRKAIGIHNTYDVLTNPDGEWRINAGGSPTWEDIAAIEIYAKSGVPFTFDIDGLCFNFGRWRSSATDATYPLRELIVVDDDLKSDNDCQRRAESLLYQRKDLVKRLDICTLGNPNILLGDKLPITIEDVSTDFYVTTVEHSFSKAQGFITTASMLDTVNTRVPPPITMAEIVKQETLKQRLYEGPVWRRGG